MENNLNISFDQTLPVVCNECGHQYFEQQLLLRMASGFLTGTGQTSYVPIPVFACTKCGYVNSEFLPKEVKNLDGE